MSRNDVERYRPKPFSTSDYDGPTDRRTVARMHWNNQQLQQQLNEALATVRSLEAEVHRLQQYVPREVLKGQRRPTRREKMEHCRPAPCL